MDPPPHYAGAGLACMRSSGLISSRSYDSDRRLLRRAGRGRHEWSVPPGLSWKPAQASAAGAVAARLAAEAEAKAAADAEAAHLATEAEKAAANAEAARLAAEAEAEAEAVEPAAVAEAKAGAAAVMEATVPAGLPKRRRCAMMAILVGSRVRIPTSPMAWATTARRFLRPRSRATASLCRTRTTWGTTTMKACRAARLKLRLRRAASPLPTAGSLLVLRAVTDLPTRPST